MSFPNSVENFWRRNGIRALLDYLGVPFGHAILTDQKPAEMTNKTIDGNKNTLLNIGGAGVPDGDETTKGKVRFATHNESVALEAVQGNDPRMSNSRSPLAHTHVKADVTDFAHTHVKADITDFAHSHVAADLPDASTTAKGIVQLANNNESTAGEVVQSNDDRMSNARTPLAHTHVEADITDLSIETAKIENDAVTYAKMQNVAAASKLLGRGDSGSGDPQEITLGTNLSMSGTTLNATGGGGSADDAGIVRVNDVDINTVDRKLNFSNDFVGTEDSVNDEVEIDIKDGSTSQKGIVQIATDGESNANEVCRSDDSRLSNARTPTAHTHVEADITDLSIETAKIENDAVTYAKIQNVVNDDRVLGRISGANGNVEELTGSDVRDLIPDASTSAKGVVQIATDGESNANEVCRSDDTRLSNARTPTAHTHVKAYVTDFAHTHPKADLPSATAYEDEANTYTGTQTVNALLEFQKNIKITGFISPPQITADQNDYNPTGLSTTSGLLIDLDANRTITGVAAQPDGTILAIVNTHSSFILTIRTENASSTDVNRFNMRGDISMRSDQVCIFRYETNRWRYIAGTQAPQGSVGTGELISDSTDNTKLANMAGFSVKAKPTTGSGDPTDLAMGSDSVLIRKSGDIVAEKIDTAQINDDQVTYAKIQNVVNDDRFLGRISGANGNVEEITPTDATALLDIFTSTLKGIAPASGGGSSNFLRADGTWAAPPAGGTVDTLPEDINLSGMITPAQITANQNDYNPTSWNVSAIMRLSSDASRDITGLTKTTTGRLALLINEGTNPIVLKNDNASSSATNRFKFGYGQDIVLRPEKCILLWHDATDDRWRHIGGNVNLKEEMVAQWYQSATKTNIGTSYVDIYTATGSEGKPVWIDFTGYTHYRVIAYWNKIGTGTQQLKFCDVANPTTNILHNFSNIVSNENDSGITALPSFAASGGRFEIKMMALSSVSTDDPVFENAIITLI